MTDPLPPLHVTRRRCPQSRAIAGVSFLRDLKRRGLRAPRLVIGDGHLGIWGALAAVFPSAAEQRCWNHRLVNLLDKLPQRLQPEAKSLLTKIPYADTREDAERQKRAFQTWAGLARRHSPTWVENSVSARSHFFSPSTSKPAAAFVVP